MTDSPTFPAIDVTEASRLATDVLDEVCRAVVGKREQLSLILCGVLAGGHVLLEDLPGLGKTLAARSFAQTLGLEFTRAQFTPDLLPADLTGSFVFDRRTSDFEFRKGPLFTGLLLADEINRTPPRTQSALLEAMQERQITVEGRTFALDAPFHVLATANPVEYEGTYPLPEAQLDRFLLRISFGYPSPGDEWEILNRRVERKAEAQQLRAIVDPAMLLAMQQAVEGVEVDEDVGRYCVDLTVATRQHPQVLVGASPRGALSLMLCGRAHAVLDGRDFVTPDDVKAVAHAVLPHRLTIRPELWLTDASGTTVVEDVRRSPGRGVDRGGEPRPGPRGTAAAEPYEAGSAMTEAAVPAPRRWVSGRVDGGQALLRLVVVLSGLAALASIRLAATEPRPVLDLVIVGLLAVTALFPDRHAGLAVVALVGVDWTLSVDDATTPWAMAAGAALVTFHSTLALATIAPIGARLEDTTPRRWARRTATVIALVLPTWLAVGFADRLELGVNQLLVGLALLAVALIAMWSRHGGLGRA